VSVVAERFANLGDEVRQVGLGDERVGPEPLLQDGPGQDFRALQRERFEQIERLGRQMDAPPGLARELAGVGVENERAEANPQEGLSLQKTGIFPRTPAGLSEGVLLILPPGEHDDYSRPLPHCHCRFCGLH
jgi:hypothetical protein